MTPQDLPLNYYEAHLVLLPGKSGKAMRGVRITIFGEYFPVRAVEPEILVGEKRADIVRIRPDQRSIEGFFLQMPPNHATIQVRYGDTQLGQLRERFLRDRVRPLPKEC